MRGRSGENRRISGLEAAARPDPNAESPAEQTSRRVPARETGGSPPGDAGPGSGGTSILLRPQRPGFRAALPADRRPTGSAERVSQPALRGGCGREAGAGEEGPDGRRQYRKHHPNGRRARWLTLFPRALDIALPCPNPPQPQALRVFERDRGQARRPVSSRPRHRDGAGQVRPPVRRPSSQAYPRNPPWRSPAGGPRPSCRSLRCC